MNFHDLPSDLAIREKDEIVYNNLSVSTEQDYQHKRLP